MKKIIVTGAGGFIGRQTLAPLVKAGYDVHAICHKTKPGAVHLGVTWHEADIFASNDVKGILADVRPDAMLHMAWGMEYSSVWNGLENLEWLAASIMLYRYFAEAGGGRVVGVGSCAEYDWSIAAGTPLREFDTPSRPTSLYGIGKKMACETLALFSQAQGLSWAWGRLFHLFGPHEDARRLVPYVIRVILAGGMARCTAGTQVRDFMDTRDAGRALADLVASDVQGPVNVASGRPITIGALVGMIAEACGAPDQFELDAIPMRPDDAPYVVADVRRLGGEIAFTPVYTLERGIQDAVDWWRNAKHTDE